MQACCDAKLAIAGIGRRTSAPGGAGSENADFEKTSGIGANDLDQHGRIIRRSQICVELL